jgi:hypothetical protein
MTLRESGKNEFLEGISYTGGVEDPAVWNHFEAEGRLRNDFENLDIHISCPVPDDPEVAGKSIFYIDDVSLQALEEPPLVVSSPLDEYYVGESIPWTTTATAVKSQMKVALWAERQLIAEQEGTTEAGQSHGTFDTTKLRPGIYTLRATLSSPQQTAQTAQWQIIIAPAPFAF